MQAILILARAYLPKHYFVYVFINAFFAAGLIAVLLAFSATALLLLAGAFQLRKTVGYLPAVPAADVFSGGRAEWLADFDHGRVQAALGGFIP